MRRGLKKSKQMMAELISAVLLMTSLPQGSTYVYAAEQMSTPQAEAQISENAETTYSNMAAETAEGSEAARTQEAEDKPEQQETVENEETQDEIAFTQNADCEETEPKTEAESKTKTEPETETTSQEESEETDTEAATESECTELECTELETVHTEETAPQERLVSVELAGVYQFGSAPSERGHVSAFSESVAADTDTARLEQYLYQQMKERRENINIESYGISKDQIGAIISGVLNENPDLYFVKKGFSYWLSGNNVLSVDMSYDTSYDDDAFQQAVKKALAVVKPEMSALQKAIALHDYLTVNCEYDKENYDNNEIPDASYTAYGTLVNRTSVCEGYALTYKYLLNQSGIKCLMVRSDKMNHAWNLVQLDGKYYQVDVTWDDPTWDQIGRARHQHMFRSDDAFETACEHYGWTVTEGSEVVDYKAADTSYDNAFWLKSNAPLVFVGEDCYYVTYEDTSVIKRTRLSDTTEGGTTVCELGRWAVWQGNGFWQGAYSGLFYANDRLYYNDQSAIHSFALDSEGNAVDKREEFKADTSNGYIYGSAFCQGKVLYSIHQNPNISAKETVLTADITIEIEQPSEIPVEKIELDQETLTLAAGDTAVLKAVVTPNDATDAEITWESSDTAIAAVSDGTVTAVAAGSCTITASAGGKMAVCEVLVTDNQEDASAGGSYGNITWKIDKDGKLTVTGTGEFSEAGGLNRAPWYDSRELITSAEIKVSELTDASAMFYHCEKLASVDVSGLDTKAVTNMSQMFGGCSSLTMLDLSSLDASKVINISGIFEGCAKLSTIYTPVGLTIAAALPASEGEVWYQPDKTVITELPRNLSHSVQLTKNSVPTVKDPYIRIQKTKTVYQCGDSLNTDDLTVMYYGSDGTAEVVTDYTTNAKEIDMSVAGTKKLTVNYQGLTAALELIVTAADPGKETCKVTFDLQGHGTVLEEYFTYTAVKKGTCIKPPTAPTAEGYEFTGWYKEADCKTLWDFAKNTIEKDTILYAGWEPGDKPEEKPQVNSVLFPKQKSEYSAVYTGEQIRPVMIVAHQYTDANGKTKTQKLRLNVDYTVRYSNNVEAGENTAQVTVRGIGEYTGSMTKNYTILPKSIRNVTISPVGDIVFGEKPSVRVTDGVLELAEGTDYTIHLSTTGSADSDTQSVLTVEGIGNYTGTSKKSAKFNILKTDTELQPISSQNIRVTFKKLPAKGYTYNGKAQKPSVVVTDTSTGRKISSSMYKVIYSDNINAGEETAKVWVVGVSKKGRGYYGKSDPLYFDIKQKDFGKVSASLTSMIPKTGDIDQIKKAIREAITVKDAKHVFFENEYTIDYGALNSVGEIQIGVKYPITLTPKAGGNYVETSQKKISIKFGQLNLASKTANVSVKITNAPQGELELSYNGTMLEKDKDYTATVKPEKNKKTYTVKIRAVKNSAYKGSRTFKNVPYDQGTGEDGSDEIIDPAVKPAVSNNKDAQNYRWNDNYNWNWADTVKSYLYENQHSGITRVEYINGKIVAEDYDDSFKLRASRTIPMELSIWGGFYAGAQYNFLIFGQKNSSQDDNAEVVRVVKYSKDWQRLGQASLCGANTVMPFDAGSLRCAEYGGYLYIRTSHKMYASDDGLNHQANMTLAVRQNDMEITDSFYRVMNSCVGYASHSFNQFILVDQNQKIVALDHGDAYPRSIVLTRPKTAKAGDDKLSGGSEESSLVDFPGEIGENCTGASVGGFAETKNGYITAFNYDGKGSKASRAVYLGYTDKSELASKVTPITAYDGMRTPVLAPAGLDGGYVMWTDAKGKFYYTQYADGGAIGTVGTASAALSDCQPIVHNGAVIWYVTQKSVPVFYKLDLSSHKISEVKAK